MMSNGGGFGKFREWKTAVNGNAEILQLCPVHAQLFFFKKPPSFFPLKTPTSSGRKLANCCWQTFI